MDSDGEEFCRNNGGSCSGIASRIHDITCRVQNSASDPPTMALTVGGYLISSGSPVQVTTDSHGYYDAVIAATYNVSENAEVTCKVTDTRGTYSVGGAGRLHPSSLLMQSTYSCLVMHLCIISLGHLVR